MSFTGDLEHLPIVDVIQLLNSTRKSGVLSIRGRKGESQLSFREGFIVSASHLDGSVRIGQVLLEKGAITQADLDRALQEQSRSENGRYPLITTLLELELVDEKAAYAGLQSLIEMTIVEVLTWKSGTFQLKPIPDAASDDYQYCPKNFSPEINVDTQGVLMDALRVFDEKVRDGELSMEEETEITEDDLGLSDLDQLDRRIPGVFATLDDRHAAGAPSPTNQLQSNLVRSLNELITALPGLNSAPQVALVQLRYVRRIFPRALTLVVRNGELIAEKGTGIEQSASSDISSPLGFRLPLTEGGLLQRVLERGEPYWGNDDDTALRNSLFSRIGPPQTSAVLLLPVRAHDRAVFLTYADFGAHQPEEVPLELLEMLCGQTRQALERILPNRAPVQKAH